MATYRTVPVYLKKTILPTVEFFGLERPGFLILSQNPDVDLATSGFGLRFCFCIVTAITPGTWYSSFRSAAAITCT